MRSKRGPILAALLMLPVALLILLLARACQAQEITPPPELMPAEPVEVLQEQGVLPHAVNAAGLALVKSVGLDPILDPRVDCPKTETVNAVPGSRAYYCYRIANTGTISLTKHTLVDDQFGTILSNYEFILPAGASAVLTRTATISTTTVNAAVWTASDVNGGNTVAAYDRAGVFVVGAQPLACGAPAVNFDQGIPLGWQVVNHPDDSPVYWTNVGLSWETGNYTGGGGDAASASSRFQNGGSGLYDSELRSPAFSLNGAETVNLHFLANYQHNANDALDLSISTSGGTSWATLLHWTNDHGSGGSPPGDTIEVDLSPYSGMWNLMLRWRYYNLVGPASQPDLYAQIDQVSLQCQTNAAINFTKTAGSDPACEKDKVSLVAPGTRLTYCYKVTNIGPTPLTLHDLVDSQEGDLLTDFSFNLAPVPGTSAIFPQPVTILTDTVTTATWTASNPSLGVSAKASDTLTIKVGQPVYFPFISSQSQIP